MAFSHADRFPKLQFMQSELAKALSHPARIIVLDHLLKNGTTVFEDLLEIVPLAQPTVSQHLKILRKAQLITAEQVVPHTYYSLNLEMCRRYFDVQSKLIVSFVVAL